MKKILLLLTASLVLFVGCQKEDTEPVADSLFDVTKPFPCPECGAVYSVTCKNTTISGAISVVGGDD